YDDQKQWTFPGNCFDDIVPVPTLQSILELRIFGKLSEIHLWRGSDGELLGRIVKDLTCEDISPLSPKDESRLLLGYHSRKIQECDNGFVLVRDDTGARQVLPQVNGDAPQKLNVKHYFNEDEETGTVRYCLCRFVEVS
ncbi:MAG TPA: CRISPR-associated protein Csx19, partial [bacterium]|nr:CRISPR-associated protein Csx19 [bacterium]